DLPAAQDPDVETLYRGGALLSEGLAPAAREGRKEFVKARIAAVEPMVLNAVAYEPIAALALGRASLIDEGDVRRGHVVLGRHRLDCGQQLLRPSAQQPPPGHWSEGHGDLELGIIFAAGLLPRIGPAMIEHIFALAVSL